LTWTERGRAASGNEAAVVDHFILSHFRVVHAGVQEGDRRAAFAAMLIEKTAVSGVSVAGRLGGGLIRALAGQVAWVKSVMSLVENQRPPMIRHGSLTNLELTSCKISKHPRAAAAEALCREPRCSNSCAPSTITHINVRPATHAEWSSGDM
jgi:hypothetical protein